MSFSAQNYQVQNLKCSGTGEREETRLLWFTKGAVIWERQLEMHGAETLNTAILLSLKV